MGYQSYGSRLRGLMWRKLPAARNVTLFWSERLGLPIGVGVKPHIFGTLFCEFLLILPHLFQLWVTTSHHFSALRSSSQTISALLNSSHNSSELFSIFFISSHLSSTLFTSSHLFLTLLNDSHLCLTLLSSFTSAQLISTLLTSCQLFSPFYLFSQRCFTRTNFYQGSFYTRIFLHREAFTQRSFKVHNDHNGSRNCSSKTGSRRQSEKDDFGALFKMNVTRKTTSAKMEKKSAAKSPSQP